MAFKREDAIGLLHSLFDLLIASEALNSPLSADEVREIYDRHEVAEEIRPIIAELLVDRYGDDLPAVEKDQLRLVLSAPRTGGNTE
jgi:hypothetical protein